MTTPATVGGGGAGGSTWMVWALFSFCSLEAVATAEATAEVLGLPWPCIIMVICCCRCCTCWDCRSLLLSRWCFFFFGVLTLVSEKFGGMVTNISFRFHSFAKDVLQFPQETGISEMCPQLIINQSLLFWCSRFKGRTPHHFFKYHFLINSDAAMRPPRIPQLENLGWLG